MQAPQQGPGPEDVGGVRAAPQEMLGAPEQVGAPL